MNIKNNQQGVVVLLTLIIMFILSTIGLITAAVVLSKIKIIRNDVWSRQAYYAADSGLEKSLYKIRIARETGSGLSDTLNILSSYDHGSEDFINGSEFEVFAEIAPTIKEFESRKISPQKSVEFHFFDPDFPIKAMEIEYFLPTWTDSCNGLSTLEFSIYEVSQVLAGESGAETIYKNIIDCGGLVSSENICQSSQIGANIPALLAAPTANESYIVRATSIKKNLADCEVTLEMAAYGGKDVEGVMVPDFDNKITIPANILIDSVGSSNTSKIRLKAYVPWKYEASGLTDFVIFSEEILTK